MADVLKPGDTVTWETPQGQTQGVVEKKVTAPVTIKTHTAQASKENPEYLVKSTKTGKKAVHRPGGLTKK